MACMAWDEAAGMIVAAAIIVGIGWWALRTFMRRMDKVDSYR